MKTKVVVVGAGGFGREVCDVVAAITEANSKEIELAGVLDDSPSTLNLERCRERGIRYLGTIDDFIRENQSHDFRYVVGINSPKAKKLISEKFDNAGYEAEILVHPHAVLGSEVTFSPGAVVCSGVQLTTNIKVGHHAHININATVGHDTYIGEFVSINPLASISGDVTLGDSVIIGASAFLLQGIRIGENATVGVSACVTRDVPSGVTVFGVPARVISHSTESENNRGK